MQEIYQRVADTFAARIHEVFITESSLEAEFKKQFELVKFSRTDHASTLLNKMFRDCWRSAGPTACVEPTGYDKLGVLRCLYTQLDYSLFTQILLNLQAYTGMAYLTGDAQAEMDKLKAAWPKDTKLNPFAPRPAMVKNAATDEEKQYNQVVSTLKSLKIISQFTPQVSFRISPIGYTPAFADSRNISMMGPGSDKYLKTLPNLKAFYIHWAPGTTPQMAEVIPPRRTQDHQPHPDGGTELKAEGIPYHFFSKSGGDTLQEVLFARKIMAEVFAAHDITKEMCIMVPRMNSVLIVTDKEGVHLKKAFDKLKAQYPTLELSEGTREASYAASNGLS